VRVRAAPSGAHLIAVLGRAVLAVAVARTHPRLHGHRAPLAPLLPRVEADRLQVNRRRHVVHRALRFRYGATIAIASATVRTRCPRPRHFACHFFWSGLSLDSGPSLISISRLTSLMPTSRSGRPFPPGSASTEQPTASSAPAIVGWLASIFIALRIFYRTVQ